MDYKDRELLTGLDTEQMLAVLGDEERQSVLGTAAIVRQVLADIPPPDKPTFSNIALANLAYFMRIGNYKSLPMLYSDDFTRELYRHLLRCGRTAVGEALMDDIMAVTALCPSEELSGIQRAAEAHRRKESPFDFGVLDTVSAQKENVGRE